MRAIVDAKAFSTALSQAEKVLQKSSIPALEGILVRFFGDSCSLTGTDLTTWLRMTLPARGDDFSFVIQKPGIALKACRYFDGELVLELVEGKAKYPKIVLSCGRRSGEFDTLPAKDHPELPEQREGVSFQANAASLLKRVERVKYAVKVPQDDLFRADQTCVQFCGNDVFCLDGQRAACDTDATLTVPRPFMTWGKSLAYLKLMGNSEVRVRVDEYSIWFSTDTVMLCCRNEGVATFPLASAVPKTFQEEFYVNTAEFARELAYLKGFIQPRQHRYVRFCGGQMMASDGSNRCATSIRIEGHSELTVGFSFRFMEEALKQFKGEDFVKIKFSSEIGPIMIEAEGRNDFALVCPSRLGKSSAA